MVVSDTDQGAVVDGGEGNREWQIRPYLEDDNRAIVALVNAKDAAYKLQEGTSEADLRLSLESPRSDPARQIIIVEGQSVEGLPEGMIAGYGRLSYETDEEAGEQMYFPRVTVHPAVEGRGLERVILARLLEIAHEYQRTLPLPKINKTLLKAWTREEVAPMRALWEGVGMKMARQFWTMARPLHLPIDEPQVIEGVNIRNYRRPEDDEGARLSFNNSFSDHWDYHPAPPEDWTYWMGSPPTRPHLSWLAEVEAQPGSFGGFCIVAISDDDNKRHNRCEGWIEILGTTREWRRKGLGRALLLHGLHSLKSEGMDTAVLGVDSLSLTGANRLYESVGFRIRNRELAYECPLDEVKL